MTDDVRRVFLYTSGRIDVLGPEMETNAVIMRDEDYDRLRAELDEAKKLGDLHKSFHDLVVKERDLARYQLAEAKERARLWEERFDRSEDLRVHIRNEERRGHIITDEQINKAWEKLHLQDAWSRQQLPPSTAIALDVFRDLGIVSCDECGGCATPGCACNGNGWVMEER